jgi:hypothetical protein
VKIQFYIPKPFAETYQQIIAVNCVNISWSTSELILGGAKQSKPNRFRGNQNLS